jgi:yecA family protein
MNQTIVFPEYSEIQHALASTGATLSASEAHGLMCGMICSSPYKNAPQWEPLLLGEKPNQKSKKILQQLYMYSDSLISEFALEFILALPDDEADINERTECLGLWCQGFLVGLQQGPLKLAPDADTEATEALHDLTEIAQVTTGRSDTGNDEDEAAYLELVEYVRLAVLMLYHELRTPSTKPSGSPLQ